MGMQITINAVLHLWGKIDLHYLCTRRLSQDCIENLFGAIRAVHGPNDHPNATKFSEAYRKCAVNSFLKSGDNGNCETDLDLLLSADGAPQATVSHANDSAPTDPAMPTVYLTIGPPVDPMDHISHNVLAYIGGYLLAKGLPRHDCSQCEAALRASGGVITRPRDALIALKSYTGVGDDDVGSLMVPSEKLFQLVVTAAKVVEAKAPGLLCGDGIISTLLTLVMSSPQYAHVEVLLCPQNNLIFMIKLFMRMQIYKICEKVTQQARSKTNKGAGRASRKLLKLN